MTGAIFHIELYANDHLHGGAMAIQQDAASVYPKMAVPWEGTTGNPALLTFSMVVPMATSSSHNFRCTIKHQAYPPSNII